MSNKLLAKIENFALENYENDDIHGFEHIKRVYKLCIYLGKKLRANLLILQISALLHDIGRKKIEDKNQNKSHSELSAEIAYAFLKSNDIFLEKDDIENILHSIKAHSYSNNIGPKTLEAKILSDADKLDAIGAIGLYRTIGYTTRNNGNLDNVIEHIEKKILNLKDQLYFEESKEIAYTRHRLIQEFHNQILLEK
ncbi:MAG: HD domain-containing protein [Candidatus Lokiarchaeota archaeon]|nr:HD domain-containing protein [Candidatus Lokiarchaeota archaeon]